jgi:hypothetical protein
MVVGTVPSSVLAGAADLAMVDPYLFEPTGLHQDFDWYFAHGYDQTINLFPSIDHRPAPDAQHLVLQALSLAVVIVTTIAVLRCKANT